MSKLSEALSLLAVFKQEGCEFEDLEHLESLIVDHMKENTPEGNSVTTVYDKIVMDMTTEELAQLNVRMVLLNMDECWWMTSSGQLYPFAHKQLALQHELQYLSQELEMPD